MHEKVFFTWTNYRLEKQKADLDLYFSGLAACDRAAAARKWLRVGTHISFVPESASSVSRRLYCCDLEALIGVTDHELRVEGRAETGSCTQPGGSAAWPAPKARHAAVRGVTRGTPTCSLNCSGLEVSNLSAREQQVLELIGQGKASKEIAALLFITNATVNEYRKRIRDKLNLHSTAELVACAVGRVGGICRQPIFEERPSLK